MWLSKFLYPQECFCQVWRWGLGWRGHCCTFSSKSQTGCNLCYELFCSENLTLSSYQCSFPLERGKIFSEKMSSSKSKLRSSTRRWKFSNKIFTNLPLTSAGKWGEDLQNRKSNGPRWWRLALQRHRQFEKVFTPTLFVFENLYFLSARTSPCIIWSSGV